MMTGSTVSPAPLNISLDDIKPGADAVLVACFSGSNAPPPEECTSRSSYCAADISAALSMSYPSPDAQQPHSPSYGLEEIETPNNASSSTAPWVGATVVATTPLAKAAVRCGSSLDDDAADADAVRDLKIALIRDALARSSGNRTVAAESLGLHRQSLTRMIRDLDLREIAG